MSKKVDDLITKELEKRKQSDNEDIKRQHEKEDTEMDFDSKGLADDDVIDSDMDDYDDYDGDVWSLQTSMLNFL